VESNSSGDVSCDDDADDDVTDDRTGDGDGTGAEMSIPPTPPVVGDRAATVMPAPAVLVLVLVGLVVLVNGLDWCRFTFDCSFICSSN
jgi:hypothetical protein